jgi:predicted esterase
MNNHQIIVPQTRHFFSLGVPSPEIKRLWIVCHGYAQLADDFLKNFEILNDGTNLVVAPEGQNVWYRKGFDGAIVANWMTRRHRLDAIENYAEFLQTVHNQYVTQLSADVKVILLGFSQGTATVNRWIFARRPAFDHLVLWGGLFPEDLNYAAAADYFSTKKLWLIYGSHDPFLTEERKSAHELLISKNQLDVARAIFEGEHEMDAAMLERLVRAIG